MTDRSLREVIAAGDLDDHLPALARAIEARRGLLYTVRSATALPRGSGSPAQISPRYLAGHHATVVDIDGSAATVQLDRPVGRFAAGHDAHPPDEPDAWGDLAAFRAAAAAS